MRSLRPILNTVFSVFPAASVFAAGASLVLALAIFALPMAELPVIAEGEATGDFIRVTGTALSGATVDGINYTLPNTGTLVTVTVLALLAGLATLVPQVGRTARYLVMLAGVITIILFGRIALTDTGLTELAISQQLASGFWLGALASVVMMIQLAIPGPADPISNRVGEWARHVRITRQQILSAILLVLGVVVLFQTWTSLTPDVITVLTFSGGSSGGLLEMPVPTRLSLLLISAYFVLVGIPGLFNIKGFKRTLNVLLLIGGILIFPMLLIGAAAGDSTNVTTIITESLRTATPIAIGAMAGIWTERSGVINIAIEGMMLFGACIAFTVVFLLRVWYPDQSLALHLVLGVIAGIFSGGLASLLHAWLSITFATDQIVSGTVINILALGITSYIRAEVLLSSEAGLNRLPAIEIPVLADLPLIGPLFNSQPIFYLMILIVIGTHLILFQTRWGLRTRAVGENPRAADTLGIKVNRVRWINVFIGGLIAGLAGAWFSLEATGRFTDGMTDGKGFISLAAMIFGKWTPAGSFGGSLLFGFAETLGFRFQIEGVGLPPQFLQMVPYLVTLIVLAGLVGRAIPPKAIGQPYRKEEG